MDRPEGRDQRGEMDQEGVNDDVVCEDLIAHESQWHALALPVLEDNLMIRTSRCTLIADLELCNKLETEVMIVILSRVITHTVSHIECEIR